MTEAQILPILSAWNDAMRECEERMDQLAEIVGPLVDRPLGDAIYRVMGAYTKTVAALIELIYAFGAERGVVWSDPVADERWAA